MHPGTAQGVRDADTRQQQVQLYESQGSVTEPRPRRLRVTPGGPARILGTQAGQGHRREPPHSSLRRQGSGPGECVQAVAGQFSGEMSSRTSPA